MLTAVLIVLLLTGRAAPYTFTGGTENGSFTCHCEPDVQCNDETGVCPEGARCDRSGSFSWGSTACQYGNDALWRGTTDQTGDGDHEADRCIDNDTNNDITQGSCCNPRRADGVLSWTLDLGGKFAINNVHIYPAADDVYMDTVRGVEVYVSASRTLTDDELCGEGSGGIIFVGCSYMIGRYVIIRQPDVTIEEMVFCEVRVDGYEYYPCGFYDGDYRWRMACVRNCHCEHQCDVITGGCDGDCTAGWRKDSNGRCEEPCDPGFWGVNCEFNCHQGCENSCDAMTGVCNGDCTSGFWGVNCESNCHCENSCDVITGVCDGDCTSGFWGADCHPCRCLDASEACNLATGHCESGCDDRYIGDGCNVVKPTLRESTITFTEHKDVITVTITDVEYRTELVSEYLVQYKLLHEDTFISINVNPISKRRRREVGEVGEDDVVLQIPFSDQSINSRYQFRITPLISSPEYNGVVGLPSNITLYNSGCLHYTGLPSCNHWCVCSDDPGTLCLLTCDYCHVCDSESELPSPKNVNFELTDITTNSLRIQFIDAHPDLPFIPLFLTRLGDHHANISSLSSNTDYTYDSLNPNTAYDIEVTAVLEDGVLSKSWTLTATTLTEFSDNNDNILPVVVGCVVSVAVVVALSVVIGILFKRRKARQSQEEAPQEQQPEESYDYIDESSMRTSTQTSDNMHLTLAVTPSDGYEQLETNTREQNKLYENENGDYSSIEKDAE